MLLLLFRCFPGKFRPFRRICTFTEHTHSPFDWSIMDNFPTDLVTLYRNFHVPIVAIKRTRRNVTHVTPPDHAEQERFKIRLRRIQNGDRVRFRGLAESLHSRWAIEIDWKNSREDLLSLATIALRSRSSHAEIMYKKPAAAAYISLVVVQISWVVVLLAKGSPNVIKYQGGEPKRGKARQSRGKLLMWVSFSCRQVL